MIPASGTRKTLLVSGVAAVRSGIPAEAELTQRLVDGVRSAASDSWDVSVSWAEDDGVEGTLGRLPHADAVVIMGGPDVSPGHYGGSENYPESGTHFPTSDASQLALIHTAISSGVPILGICRGLQLLNVALGGTLIQHLEGPTHSNPALLDHFEFARHAVALSTDTPLGRAIAASEGAFPTIHSAHHQAINRLGDSLAVVARSEDGIIEAVQHTSAPAIAVQWHPEDPDADQSNLRSLLSYLDDCRMRTPASRMRVAA